MDEMMVGPTVEWKDEQIDASMVIQLVGLKADRLADQKAAMMVVEMAAKMVEMMVASLA
jgi:hypothetical protein